MTVILLCDAVQAVVEADDAYNAAHEGPAYELIDAASETCRKVLARRPGAVGPLIQAARAVVAWDDVERENQGSVDWDRYDIAVAACRHSLKC